MAVRVNQLGSIKAVAILSNYGNRNLGDEATLAAILQQLRERCNGARFFAISFDPQDTETRHGITALPATRPIRHAVQTVAGPRNHTLAQAASRRPTGSPALTPRLRTALLIAPLWRRLRGLWTVTRDLAADGLFAARTVRTLRTIDCLVVGGGGQLSDDFGGLWAFPYLLLKWTLMARLAGARVLFVSVGAGPLDSRLARLFIKTALRLADYHSFRDDGSRALIANLGVVGPVRPDPAWALPVEKLARSSRSVEPSLIVGLNPFPYQDARYWPGGDRTRYEAYLESLARFMEYLIVRGHSVVLFPTQLRSDPCVIADLKARLSPTALQLPDRVLAPMVETIDDLVATISGLDVLVSGRFHGILLAFLLRKPVLGLSYHSKIDELMRRAGQDAYLLSALSLHPRALVERFEQLASARDTIAIRLAAEARRCRTELESQFDTIFPAKISEATPA
jgi:polysaccharide pyruvyl transferase WcaK-like protein